MEQKGSYRSPCLIPFYKWRNRSGVSASEWESWPRIKIGGLAGICFLPRIHELPTSAPHLGLTALLQEVIDCNFRSLSLAIVMMCLANIGSGAAATKHLYRVRQLYVKKTARTIIWLRTTNVLLCIFPSLASFFAAGCELCKWILLEL